MLLVLSLLVLASASATANNRDTIKLNVTYYSEGDATISPSNTIVIRRPCSYDLFKAFGLPGSKEELLQCLEKNYRAGYNEPLADVYFLSTTSNNTLATVDHYKDDSFNPSPCTMNIQLTRFDNILSMYDDRITQTLICNNDGEKQVPITLTCTPTINTTKTEHITAQSSLPVDLGLQTDVDLDFYGPDGKFKFNHKYAYLTGKLEENKREFQKSASPTLVAPPSGAVGVLVTKTRVDLRFNLISTISQIDGYVVIVHSDKGGRELNPAQLYGKCFTSTGDIKEKVRVWYEDSKLEEKMGKASRCQ